MSGSGNFSGSKSSSTSVARDNVWGEQSPYLSGLYQQGGSVLDAASGDIGAGTAAARDFASRAGQDIYSPALANYQQQFGPGSNLSSAAGQVAPGLGQNLNQMMGDPTQNPYLQENVKNALGAVSQNFQENILPSIGTDAALFGQRGGSRQGIAEGIAAREANQQAGAIASQMYGSAFDQGQTNRLAAMQQAGGLIGGAADAASQGIAAGQSLANLGMLPASAYQQASTMGFSPLQAQASVIGAPTVLGSSYSRSKSKAYGGGGSGGM